MPQTKPKRKLKPAQPQRSKRTPVIIFASVTIIAILVGLYILSQPARAPGTTGSVAPDFQLQQVDAQGLTDNMVQLSSLRGKVVVLEFITSWCPNCQEMASSVGYLNDKYGGQDVVFLSVAGTDDRATAESTAKFIRDNYATWTHVLDTDNSVFRRYGVEATPTYFVIDRSGVIVRSFRGLVATEAFSAAIDAALSS